MLGIKDDIAGTRKEAKRLGRKMYFGTPCRRGHDGVRYTSAGNCIHCSHERHNRVLAHNAERYQRRIEIDHKKDEYHDDYYDFDLD